MSKEVVISEDYNRLDRYIKKKLLLSIPQSLLEKYLRKGMILLEGKVIKSNAKVLQGQKLSIDSSINFTPVYKQLKHQVQSKVIKHDILYQDQYIIALNKPSGLSVQGGNKVKVSLNDILPELERINDEIPRIVHRLDKDTSGILLLARTLQSARFLADAFANNQIKKTYKAVVDGQIPKKNGTIDVPLAKKVLGGQELIVPSQDGKKSITHFHVLPLQVEKNITYIELQPSTGRKHQLRSHMQHLGHPIYGDKKYGSSNKHRLCLHASAIRLTLPNKHNIDITAPLPQHMLDLLQLDAS